jgi:hypothetical protein
LWFRWILLKVSFINLLNGLLPGQRMPFAGLRKTVYTIGDLLAFTLAAAAVSKIPITSAIN